MTGTAYREKYDEAYVRELLGKLKNCTILDESVSIKSSLKADQMVDVDALVRAIMDTMPKPGSL